MADTRRWTLWVCNECGWTTVSYPPRGLCCSVEPHKNYSMTSVVVEAAHEEPPYREPEEDLYRECPQAGEDTERPDEFDGIDLIAAERMRQIEMEGWTPEHDDQHDASELVRAAIAYLTSDIAESVDFFWPWEGHEFKRGPDRTRELVKAGGLIAAEIDRLSRVRDTEQEPGR
jgi:hypothetical protein